MPDSGPPPREPRPDSSDIVIRIIGLADGRRMEAYEGMFLVGWVDTPDGMGEFFVSPDLEPARRFKTVAEAAAYWQQQSKYKPRRPDGKPNRPLTAFTVEFRPAGGRGIGVMIRIGP